MEKRIEKAKEMLLYESYSIGEIAENCGFASIYAFSRAFKNIIGVAPSDFKKKYIVSK
jgi:AraC-like DNA-binding protein